jgi:hypothetical protein
LLKEIAVTVRIRGATPGLASRLLLNQSTPELFLVPSDFMLQTLWFAILAIQKRL